MFTAHEGENTVQFGKGDAKNLNKNPLKLNHTK